MGLLYGVHENVDPAGTVKRLGGNATRDFTPGVIGPRDLVKAATAVCAPSWKAGLTSVWSFKPLPADVASGRWRPFVEEFGRFLADSPDKRTVVVPWHEGENDVPKWFRDADAYVRMFDTVAGWLRSTHPGVVIAHAALAYRYGDGKGIDDKMARRWRTSADLHCVDIYSGRTNPLETILPELSSYRRWREHVAGDSPWGVTERGWTCQKHDFGRRAATISREAEWLAAQALQPEIYLLWNTGGSEGDAGLVLDNTAEIAAKGLLTRHARRVEGRIGGVLGLRAAAGNAVVPGGDAAAMQPRRVTCPRCAHEFPLP